MLNNLQGIVVPGGFGNRGVNGKILTAYHARINNIPYLGICLGMQISVIEFARNVLGLKKANSTEFDLNTLILSFLLFLSGKIIRKANSKVISNNLVVQ